MEFMRYSDYLQSDHWQQLRLAALKRYGQRCSRCKSTANLEVHHKIYRETFHASLVKDLQVLCHACHQEEHGFAMPLRFSEPRKKRKAAREEVKTPVRSIMASPYARTGNFTKSNGRLIYNPK